MSSKLSKWPNQVEALLPALSRCGALCVHPIHSGTVSRTMTAGLRVTAKLSGMDSKYSAEEGNKSFQHPQSK